MTRLRGWIGILVVGGIALGGGLLYAFGGWWEGDDPEGLRLPKIVAKVGVEAITRKEVYRRIRQYESMSAQAPRDNGLDERRRMAHRIVDLLIQQRLIMGEAKRLGVEVTDAEVDQQYAQTEARFGAAEFAKKLEEGKTDAVILKRDIRDFMTLQKVELALRDQIVVTDEEVRRYFEANRASLLHDMVRVGHILVGGKAEADTVYALLTESGKPFAWAAAEYSLDSVTKGNGGDLGWMARDQLAPEFRTILSGLGPGGISAPVKTPLGFHILRLEEIKLAADQTLVDHVDHIRGIIRDQQWQGRRQAWVDSLRERETIWRAHEVS